MKTRGGTLLVAAGLACGSGAGFAQTSDAPVIVFSGYRLAGESLGIYQFSPGSPPKVLVNTEADEVLPFAFPGGQAIGYLVESNAQHSPVYRYDLSSGQITNLGVTAHVESSCQASPEGKRLACSQWDGHFFRIVVHDLESRGSRQLTTLRGRAYDPSWAPDGKRLVFWLRGGDIDVGGQRKPYGDHLVICNLDTDHYQLLTRQRGRRDQLPRWSPDGQWIVFSRRVRRVWNLWVIRPDGTEETQLTKGLFGDSYPAWSPDSKSVVFEAYLRGKRCDIHRVDLATKLETEMLRTDTVNEYQPIWIK